MVGARTGSYSKHSTALVVIGLENKSKDAPFPLDGTKAFKPWNVII